MKKSIFLLRVSRAYRFSLDSIRRAPSEVIGVVSSLSIALLFFIVFITITLLADTTMAVLANKLDLPIEIKREASFVRVQAAKKQLESHPDIKSVRYVSQDDNVNDFSKKFPDIADSLKSYGLQNPLPSMFYVLPNNTSGVDKIINSFNNEKWDDVLDFSILKEGDILSPIRKLSKIAGIIEFGIVVITIFAILAAMFSSFAATRTALLAREEEIKLMKIIGADISFIRMPFVMEGIILGAISTIIVLFIFFIFVFVTSSSIAAWFSNYPISLDTGNPLYLFFPLSGKNLSNWFILNFPFITILFVLISSGIGGLSAMLATEK